MWPAAATRQATSAHPAALTAVTGALTDSKNLASGASLSVHMTSPTTFQSCGNVPNTAGVVTSNDGSAMSKAGAKAAPSQEKWVGSAFWRSRRHIYVYVGHIADC